MNLSLQLAVTLSRALVGVSLALSSAELLHSRVMFSPQGISPWPLLRTIHKHGSERVEALRDTLLGERFEIVLSARLVLALLLIVPIFPTGLYAGAEGLLLITNMTLSYRGAYGGDGSEQMNTVVLAGLLYTDAVGLVVQVHHVPLGLAFIAIQLILSYFVAGVAKVISPIWRAGDAILGILKSSTYGLPAAAKWLDVIPGMSLIICWTVILFELSFPLVFCMHPRMLVAYLVLGCLFHVGNSVAMGLNTFLPAFLAAYPSLWITVQAR